MAIAIGKSNNPKTKPNHLYAIISMAMVLFLVGLFGLIVIHTSSLVRYFKENIEVTVELKDNTADTKIFAFQKRMETAPYVKKGSLKIVDKEEALEIMRKEFGDDLDLFTTNPLFDAIKFNVNAADLDSLPGITEAIKRNDFVVDVNYPVLLAHNITTSVDRLALVTFLVSIFFILIAITLINNTVKLSLYSNRFLIKTMQLVGANWSFICRPYLLKAVTNGLLSGIIAIACLLITLYITQSGFPELEELSDPFSFSILFFLLLGLGVAISYLSTIVGVRKYLKMRLDDLY